MRSIVIVVVLFLISASAAGSGGLASEAGGPILVVGPGVADSDCVGSVATPTCAVETWLACLARTEPELCAHAAPQVKIRFHPEAETYFILYQVADTLMLAPWRITPKLKAFQLEPGDVEIRLRRITCVYADGNCNYGPESGVKESYFLSPGEGGWRIIAWTDENAPETCGELEGLPDIYHRECDLFIYAPKEPWVHDRRVPSLFE